MCPLIWKKIKPAARLWYHYTVSCLAFHKELALIYAQYLVHNPTKGKLLTMELSVSKGRIVSDYLFQLASQSSQAQINVY